MKQIAILILTVLGSIHANAQNSVLDSTEMNGVGKNYVAAQATCSSVQTVSQSSDSIII